MKQLRIRKQLAISSFFLIAVVLILPYSSGQEMFLRNTIDKEEDFK